MSSIKPCIRYGDELDVKSMELAKVEVIAAGVTRSKKIPIFTATHGVEGLFHVIDKYNKTATRLNFPVADLWDLFEEVLDSVAELKWHNLIRGITPVQKTRPRFQRALNDFVALYAEDDQPRDVLIKYIQSDECRKPRKVDPGAHASRVESLCRFANRLAGTETELTEAQIKKYVFESFPIKWQNDYRKSHHDFATDTLTNIVSYMNLCKGIADDEDDKRGKKRKATNAKEERIRGGSGNDKKNGKKKRTEDNDICPVHGGHRWGVCSLNPRSALYKSGGFQGGRTGGRGRGDNQNNYGGQSYGGRGYNNGRGRGENNGGRGNQGGRFGGRGYQGGRGGQYRYNDQNYGDTNREEQPSAPHDWTQSEHYHTGPRQGGWQSGSDHTGRGSSSQNNTW